ncbi:MAG: rhomboid family intramembrane serine protease [Cyanobacteria bacterium Co-bin13]|nr:rhomboid family intramembrane serine protease [Cyanobacteria bacterium Co-bin13]
MGGRNGRTGAQELRLHLSILGAIVLVLWGVYLVNLLVFSRQLINLGIIPRSAVGLRGIVFAPLLHDSPSHLIANTVPLVTLGWLTLLWGLREFWLTTALVMLTAGLGTWLLGAPTSVHIGASGIIFGYFGFLLLRGYFERSVGAISLSLLVGVLYGGLMGGVVPGSSGVSWESHLFGFLGGAIAARLLTRPRPLS